MTLGCFILEDTEIGLAAYEDLAKQAGFEIVVMAKNVQDAKAEIRNHIHELAGFILDMSTPFTSASDEGPDPHAGPSVRDYLMNECGVSPDSILLMSNVISEYDLKSCCDHQIDPSMIVEKHELSVEKIKHTFASLFQNQ